MVPFSPAFIASTQATACRFMRQHSLMWVHAGSLIHARSCGSTHTCRFVRQHSHSAPHAFQLQPTIPTVMHHAPCWLASCQTQLFSAHAGCHVPHLLCFIPSSPQPAPVSRLLNRGTMTVTSHFPPQASPLTLVTPPTCRRPLAGRGAAGQQRSSGSQHCACGMGARGA